SYLVLNFTAEDFHEVFVHDTSMSVQLLFGDSALSLVQELYRKLGSQPPLPDWIIGGAVLGLEEGTEEALKYYYLARDAGVNVSALWLQDWSGYIDTSLGHRVYWNWAWNSSYYPGLDQVVQDLAAEGVRVTVYCNPHLIVGSPMFDEAAAAGHLMLDQEGDVFLLDFGGFFGGTVDVLDSDSMNWYAEQLKTNILDFGFSGYMADFGEYTNVDMVSKNTAFDPEEAHNYFPTAWAITNSVAVEAAGQKGEAVYWMRSGGLGASIYQTLAWAGDQNVDFTTTDGVATTIVAGL
ncbi:Glycoside hydrolase family 31, partial [Trinorchestia longiramus]